MTITRDDIDAAAARIAGRVRETPVIAVEPGAFAAAGRLVLKLEGLQHAGSFKPRGAFNRLLANAVPAAGIIAASGGNHGAAVAYAARALGHRAEIYVPTLAAPAKVARIEGYGARVVVTGDDYAAAAAACAARQAETGALAVHAYDQQEVVAGQGTVAREFERQAPGLDTVLVAVGGGGLIGGMAAWYGAGGRTRVVAVEPEACPTLHRALAAGAPVDVAVGGLAADSLGARRVGSIMFDIARRHVADTLLVGDDAIRDAQLRLWRDFRLAVEPGAATALAALVAGVYRPGAEERVGVLVCGANVDPATVA